MIKIPCSNITVPLSPSGIPDPNSKDRENVKVLVPNLTPSTEYTMRVQAENQDQQDRLSDWKYADNVRTDGNNKKMCIN